MRQYVSNFGRPVYVLFVDGIERAAATNADVLIAESRSYRCRGHRDFICKRVTEHGDVIVWAEATRDRGWRFGSSTAVKSSFLTKLRRLLGV